MNSIIDEIYRTGLVRDELGNAYPLDSHVGRDEGNFIYHLISSEPDIHKTLEVGCGYGLSSLFICSALSGRDSVKHIIIDPNESTEWHGVGICNIRRAGCDFFELIEKPSEFVLPTIAENESETFDFVLIDGWHTFDHTLLDLFYANRLIRVGGYIVIDDAHWSSVAKAISYISNYPSYKVQSQCVKEMTLKWRWAKIIRSVIPCWIAGYVLPRNLYDRYYIRTMYSSMVALKKVANDERTWTWFEPF